MVYLDNAATTRTLDIAVNAAQKYMTVDFFNPSAAYSPSASTERAVNAARQRLTSYAGLSPDELIFTSGGTESNNAAIFGSLKNRRDKGRIIISAVEHASVYESVTSLKDSYEVVIADVDSSGVVMLNNLETLLTQDTALVSIMQVNNETGALNNVQAISKLIRKRSPNAIFHVDGVQGFLKVPLEIKYCDLYSISGHKFQSPKGVGALFVKKGIRFAGGQLGGGQEHNLRSGTLNVPGIMAMDAAAAYYYTNRDKFTASMRTCKTRLAAGILNLPGTTVNGMPANLGAPHILNASFSGIRGEVLLHVLEDKGIYVSTGSACSAHKKGNNRVLTSMGLTGDKRDGAIRFSFCPDTTTDEIDETLAALNELVPYLRRFSRR